MEMNGCLQTGCTNLIGGLGIPEGFAEETEKKGMDRVLWAQGAAGRSHLCVQFGQLFLIQVGLFVDSGLVAELRPGVGYEETQTYQILCWEQC